MTPLSRRLADAEPRAGEGPAEGRDARRGPSARPPPPAFHEHLHEHRGDKRPQERDNREPGVPTDALPYEHVEDVVLPEEAQLVGRPHTQHEPQRDRKHPCDHAPVRTHPVSVGGRARRLGSSSRGGAARHGSGHGRRGGSGRDVAWRHLPGRQGRADPDSLPRRRRPRRASTWRRPHGSTVAGGPTRTIGRR